MRTEATDLIEEGGRVAGVRATSPEGDLDIRADLVVGTDGRHSTLRECAGFHVEDIGAPMDVSLVPLSRRVRTTDPRPFGHIEAGRMMVMLNRDRLLAMRLCDPERRHRQSEGQGPRRFSRPASLEMSPFLRDRIERDQGLGRRQAVDRGGRPAAAQWHKPGLLCIGDAAHAMSPIGGVGINLAIQDAVAAANFLAAPLQVPAASRRDARGRAEAAHLAIRVMQGSRCVAQNNCCAAVLAARRAPSRRFALKLLDWFPVLQRMPARMHRRRRAAGARAHAGS